MPLYRISGNTNAAYILDDYKSSEDYQSSPDYYNAIELLINYGVIKLNGDIDSAGRLVELGKILNTSEHQKIVDAMKNRKFSWQDFRLFNTIWRELKKSSLAGATNGLFIIGFFECERLGNKIAQGNIMKMEQVLEVESIE